MNDPLLEAGSESAGVRGEPATPGEFRRSQIFQSSVKTGSLRSASRHYGAPIVMVVFASSRFPYPRI